MLLTGSQIVAECLIEQGVDTVFGYPGGTILNVYDAFICGSDNIWNTNLLDTAFMLDFVPKDILKISPPKIKFFCSFHHLF